MVNVCWYIRVRLRWTDLRARHAGDGWPCPYWRPWTAPLPAETRSPSTASWTSSSYPPAPPTWHRPRRSRTSASTLSPRCSPSAPVAVDQRVRSAPPLPDINITQAILYLGPTTHARKQTCHLAIRHCTIRQPVFDCKYLSCKICFNVLNYVFISFSFNLYCLVNIQQLWHNSSHCDWRHHV